MGGEQNWGIQTDAQDYFSQRDRKLQIADRRPVIRRAADLVGPGINAAAIPITDFNDILATYNGYYSAVPGMVDAPNSTDSFVGFTVMDALMGGVQEFTSLDTGYVYRRRFLRKEFDAETIEFLAWTSDEPVPPPAATPSYWNGSIAVSGASTVNGWVPLTNTPVLANTDDPTNLVFSPVAGGIRLLETGLYAVQGALNLSPAVDGARMGASFITSGSVVPSRTAGLLSLGGVVVAPGGAGAPWISLSATFRVLSAPVDITIEYYFQSAISRTASVSFFSAFRVSD